MLESQQLDYHGGMSNGGAQIAQDPFEFRPLKVEPGTLCASQAEELSMLRVRVQQLEREMARLAAENHHLKDLLVKEIPSLLSAMRQTLAPGSSQPDLLCSISSASSSPASSVPPTSSMANSHGHGHNHSHNHSSDGSRYGGLMPWPEPGPEPIPSISEMLRHRTEPDVDVDSLSLNGTGFGSSSGSAAMDLAGSLEGALKCELSDDLEDELAPFLCDLGPRGPTATLCSVSSCQQAEMRMRGRPPGCSSHTGHMRESMEREEVFPGSGVMCESRALRRANQSATPTAMVRNLLVGVFDKQTLLSSNLRGGSSKTSPYHNHHAPLDPHKLNAIYDATLARFPNVRRAQIGISINSKLSEIRFYTRRATGERSRQ